MAKMTAADLERIESGPFGLRWSYTYDGDAESPPSLEAVSAAVGVAIAGSMDCSHERSDELCEEVYFAAEAENAIATYLVQ